MNHKILFLHQSKSYAGTDAFTINLISGLIKKGYEVELIINKNKEDLSEFKGIKLHFYKTTLLTYYASNRCIRLFKKFIIIILYPILILIHTILLLKQIKTIKPDRIIVVNGGIPGGLLVYIGAIACGISGIKTIYTIHSFVNYQRIINLYNYILEYVISLYKNITFVTVSNYSRDRIIKDSYHIKNIIVIYNGVPNFNDSNDNERSSSEFNIAFVGNLILTKGVEILIDAFNEIHRENTFLYLYVKPIDLNYLTKIREKIANNSKITMILNEHEKKKIYSNKHLIVLPSTYESFGQVLIEAMTFNVPVLGSDGMGIAEVITIDKNITAGELFKLGDKDSLKLQLEKLCNNPYLLNKYSKNCHKIYKKYFSLEIMVNKYIQLLEKDIL